MFSVVGTQCVFRCRYSICFLLKVLIMFSVKRTQHVFCFLLKVLIMFSVKRIQYVFC